MSFIRLAFAGILLASGINHVFGFGHYYMPWGTFQVVCQDGKCEKDGCKIRDAPEDGKTEVKKEDPEIKKAPDSKASETQKTSLQPAFKDRSECQVYCKEQHKGDKAVKECEQKFCNEQKKVKHSIPLEDIMPF